MREDDSLERLPGKGGRSLPYTAKDFQLEVLGQLAEMRALSESALADRQQDSERESVGERRLLRFDGRTLVAIGAIAVSLTGYVLQDARNTSRRDVETETLKVRVTNLEKIAETNTEARIRGDVELGELREGQDQIKDLIQSQVSADRKGHPAKPGESK